MTDYDVIVIGAGNGGLTASATLAKQGVRVLTLERHNIPGGCATSFCRGRFEFEVSLHQLSGLGTKEQPGPLRSVLNSIGVIDKLQFVQMTDLYRIMVPDALDVTLPANKAGALDALKKRFPQESDAIDRFFDLIYRFFNEVIGAFYLKDPDISREKYPLYFKYAFKNARSVIDEYFSDPLLKLTLGVYWTYMGLPPSLLSFSDYAALYFAYLEFKPFHLKGGSQALSNAIVDSILSNGGVVRFNCGAKKILVKDNEVKAVVTEQGEEISTRFVVSNASPITTFYEMIGSENLPSFMQTSLKGSTISTSFMTIYAGLDCDPEKVGITETTNFMCATTDMERDFELSKTIECDESSLILSCYDKADPTFSPPGACQVAIVGMKYAEPWLRVPANEYYKVKYQCAEAMLRRVEKHFPGFRENIEEIEVATPITHMRYLSQPGGSPYGFDHYLKDSSLFVSNKPPIKGLYGAGAWYGEPGYQPSLTSGAGAARAILKEMRA